MQSVHHVATCNYCRTTSTLSQGNVRLVVVEPIPVLAACLEANVQHYSVPGLTRATVGWARGVSGWRAGGSASACGRARRAALCPASREPRWVAVIVAAVGGRGAWACGGIHGARTAAPLWASRGLNPWVGDGNEGWRAVHWVANNRPVVCTARAAPPLGACGACLAQLMRTTVRTVHRERRE